MPIEPIKIPQNVHIEDRIVGPLTLKQVIICAIGGGFSYALFASMSKTYGTLALPIQVLIWLPAVVSAAFAFIRINDISMMRLCLLLLEKMNKPATRTWTPRRGIIINVRTFHTVAENKTKYATNAVDLKAREKFDELSTVLDQHPIENIPPSNPENSEQDDDFGDFLADDPTEEKELPMEEQNPNIRRPVNPARISASPIAGTPVDGVAPKSGSVSLFRDISPTR